MKYFSVGFKTKPPTAEQTLFGILIDAEKLIVDTLTKLGCRSIHENVEISDGSLYRYIRSAMDGTELMERLSVELAGLVEVVEVNELDPLNDSGYDRGQKVALGVLFELRG